MAVTQHLQLLRLVRCSMLMTTKMVTTVEKALEQVLVTPRQLWLLLRLRFCVFPPGHRGNPKQNKVKKQNK
jgi:hypothetical protein